MANVQLLFLISLDILCGSWNIDDASNEKQTLTEKMESKDKLTQGWKLTANNFELNIL